MNPKEFLQESRYYLKLEGFKRPFIKFLLYQSPLSKVVNTPFYNKLYIKRIKKESEKILPQILQIETTNACNAKCIMCPHKTMKRKIKTMNLEDFKKVLDNVIKNYPSIKRLTINGFGEPFIDRGIIEKITYANEKYPNLNVDIFTNASLMNKEKTDQLMKTKIGRMTFSVNGTEKSYKEVMGINYEETKKNILYFLAENKKKKDPALVNISMMILKENEKDSEDYVNFWRKVADSVRVYYPTDWAGSLKESMGDQKIPYGRKQWPCSALWTHIVIHSKGEFVVCCRDYESKMKFGNLIKGDDIKKLRESEKFKDMQAKHLNFEFPKPVCHNCDHAYDSSIEWWLW